MSFVSLSLTYISSSLMPVVTTGKGNVKRIEQLRVAKSMELDGVKEKGMLYVSVFFLVVSMNFFSHRERHQRHRRRRCAYSYNYNYNYNNNSHRRLR